MQPIPECFVQSGYPSRLYWGVRGARWAAFETCVAVIVDVMSFSTTVTVAMDNGIKILPARDSDEAQLIAGKYGCEMSVARRDVPRLGRFSLSPETFEVSEISTIVALHSPNGARCVWNAAASPYVFVGSLLNAASVAKRAAEIAQELRIPVAVVACGELWPGEVSDEPRFAIEDFLGAGAILAELGLPMSPEAVCAAHAFNSAQNDLKGLLSESSSGRELREMGYASDVEIASRYNSSKAIPAFEDNLIRDYS